jgi:hypothetical protein
MRWKATMTDPWADLAPPAAAATVTALRVDANIPWGFFWARDAEKNCLLILRHSAETFANGRLPRLQGVELSDSFDDRDSARVLSLRLVDFAQRDIFQQLCLDIVRSTARAATEKEALQLTLARTWRWHHLLRGGRDDRLSAEAQTGLIGELLVLERYLLPLLPPRNAVLTWRGPLDSPKDFEIGRMSIESKARRGAATPFISISSEFQLDDRDVDSLFLHVVALDSTSAAADGSFTIADVARRVLDRVQMADADAGDILAGLLTAAGFEWADDYGDACWIEGDSRVFRVSPGFPCITSEQTTLGVSRVTYSVALAACEPYRIEPAELKDALAAGIHAS